MRRWWTIPLTGLLFLLVIVSFLGEHNVRVRSREWCGLYETSPNLRRIRDVHEDWTWNPPGFDCVYTDSRGREVIRTRANPP